MKALDTLIVVPCYNEQDRLDPSEFISYLSVNRKVGFLFVNDGSRDGTAVLIDDLSAGNPERIFSHHLKENCGKAEAVRQGMIIASQRAHVIGYWDADLATPLAAIAQMREIFELSRSVQVVFGSRLQLLGRRIRREPTRKIISRGCAWLARRALELPIQDTQCGAKLFLNTPPLQQVFATPFNSNWLFDVELLLRLKSTVAEAETAFYEMPLIEWNEIAGSKVKAISIYRSLKEMLRLIFRARLTDTYVHAPVRRLAFTAPGGASP